MIKLPSHRASFKLAIVHLMILAKHCYMTSKIFVLKKVIFGKRIIKKVNHNGL